MHKTLIGLMFFGLAGFALANDPPQAESQQAAMRPMLDKMRSLESHSHHGRIKILQEAEGCIQAAQTPQAYRACEQKEQAARESLRENIRPQQQALRDEFQRMRQQRQQAQAQDGPVPSGNRL